MITNDKLKEFRKQLSRGVAAGELRESMTKDGYSSEDIDKVFAPAPYDMRSWYLGFGIVFFLAGFYPLTHGGSVVLMFAGLGLCFQYYRETQRLQKKSV